MQKYIKNFPFETVVGLADQIDILEGQVVSKTLVQNESVSLTLFGFAKDEEIGTHDSTGDAMVTVLDGIGEFTVGGTKHIVEAGQSLIMPAKVPHAVYAKEDFKMFLVVIFPKN